MGFGPRKAYPHDGEYTLSVFDLRYSGIVEQLHHERAAWGEHGDIEALDEDHFILIRRPAGSQGATA